MGLPDIFTFNKETKEKAGQLYFRDDHKFTFRFLELEDTIMVERNKDKTVKNGWKHFYSLEFPCAGYKGVAQPGSYTLSYGRDVIFDLYGILPDADKPDKGLPPAKGLQRVDNIIKWLVNIGNVQRMKIIAKRSKNQVYERITLFLGIGLMLQFLIIAIELLMKRGGG